MSQAHQRKRLRKPTLVSAFSNRLRMITEETGVTQSYMAKHFGGFSNQVVNRLVKGEAKTMPIDFVAELADWAASQGFSLRWLFTGKGEMRPETQRTEDALAASIKQIVREAVREELKNKESEK